MLTEFGKVHQNKQTFEGLQTPRVSSLNKMHIFVTICAFLATVVLLLHTTEQTYAQETIPYTTYLARISRYRTDVRRAEECADLADIADQLESITAVQMPDGSVIQVEHTGADQAFRGNCNAEQADQYLAGLCPPARCQPGQVPAAPIADPPVGNGNSLQNFPTNPNNQEQQITDNDSPVPPNSLDTQTDNQGQENGSSGETDPNNQPTNPNAPSPADGNGEAENSSNATPATENNPNGAEESPTGDVPNEGEQGEEAPQTGAEEGSEGTGSTGENGTEQSNDTGESGATGEGENGGAPPAGDAPNTENGEGEGEGNTAVSPDPTAVPTPAPEEPENEGLSRRTIIIISIVALMLTLVIIIIAILLWPAKKELIDVPGKRPKPPTTAKEALAAGRQKVEKKEYREAVRKLFLATLITLDDRGIIQYDPTLTNHEIMRFAILRPSLIKSLIPIITTYERVWYGFEPLQTAEYDTLVQQINQLKKSDEGKVESN